MQPLRSLLPPSVAVSEAGESVGAVSPAESLGDASKLISILPTVSLISTASSAGAGSAATGGEERPEDNPPMTPTKRGGQLMGPFSKFSPPGYNTHAAAPLVGSVFGSGAALNPPKPATPEPTPLSTPSRLPVDRPGRGQPPVILCGPMGAGKTGLLQRLIHECAECVDLCVSVCSYNHYDKRARLSSNAKYEYVSKKNFRQMDARNEFVEKFKTGAMSLGIRYSEVERIQVDGKIPLIDLDQRALQHLQNIPARFVYVYPPDEAELRARLRSMKVMKMLNTKEEASALEEYSKREEVVRALRERCGERQVIELENNDFDVAYNRLKKFVLENRTVTESEVQVLLQEPVAFHGVVIVVEPRGINATRYITRLRREHKEIGFAVSHTTRERKPHEEDGVHYHFVSTQTFKRMWNNQEFLELAVVGGHRYGVTKEEFQRVLAKHSSVVVKVNVSGAKNIQSVRIGARFALLWSDTKKVRKRLSEDEGLSDGEVARRIGILEEELVEAHDMPFSFDSVLDDEEEEETYARLRDFILNNSDKSTTGALADSGAGALIKLSKPYADQVVLKRKGTLRSGTAMKSDHFPSGKQRGLPEPIEGAPNFRMVALGPDPYNQDMAHTFYATAQPTVDAYLRLVMRMLRNKKQTTKILFVNLREERFVYINRKPFCLKYLQDLYHNMEDPFVTAGFIEGQEAGLKSAILQEAADHRDRFMVHDEEMKDGELAAWGEIFAYYEKLEDKSAVLTMVQVIRELQKNGFDIKYLRLPITDEKPPKDDDLDTLVAHLWHLHVHDQSSPLLFNCQLGRGRTTTVTLLSMFFLYPPTVEEAGGRVVPWGEDHDGLPPSPAAPAAASFAADAGQSSERWKCVRDLFERKGVQKVAVAHFRKLIDAAAHIQNLRTCVEDAVAQCAKATDAVRKSKLWLKTKNYLKRYYYLAMAFTYFHTECQGEYKRWRCDVYGKWEELYPGYRPDAAKDDPAGDAKPARAPASPDTDQDWGRYAGRVTPPMRLRFKQWVVAEKLWNACVDDILELRAELGVQEVDADEKLSQEFDHHGLITRVGTEGAFIECRELSEAVLAPLDLLKQHVLASPNELFDPHNPKPRSEEELLHLRVSFTITNRQGVPTATRILRDPTSPPLTPKIVAHVVHAKPGKLDLGHGPASDYLVLHDPAFTRRYQREYDVVYYQPTWAGLVAAYLVWHVCKRAKFVAKVGGWAPAEEGAAERSFPHGIASLSLPASRAGGAPQGGCRAAPATAAFASPKKDKEHVKFASELTPGRTGTDKRCPPLEALCGGGVPAAAPNPILKYPSPVTPKSTAFPAQNGEGGGGGAGRAGGSPGANQRVLLIGDICHEGYADRIPETGQVREAWGYVQKFAQKHLPWPALPAFFDYLSETEAPTPGAAQSAEVSYFELGLGHYSNTPFLFHLPQATASAFLSLQSLADNSDIISTLIDKGRALHKSTRRSASSEGGGGKRPPRLRPPEGDSPEAPRTIDVPGGHPPNLKERRPNGGKRPRGASGRSPQPGALLLSPGQPAPPSPRPPHPASPHQQSSPVGRGRGGYEGGSGSPHLTPRGGMGKPPRRSPSSRSHQSTPTTPSVKSPLSVSGSSFGRSPASPPRTPRR
eukprot:TRINITY_DN7386_c0_g2_i1.p1 TRINITY_DN7386_c0_g2~~TRINITY_DN7386_c0_g2_i1.p1  ORF type:complete len:1695 (+),score=591.46 TRINITY_DN7386_c0_g2_i1:244-5085(+)